MHIIFAILATWRLTELLTFDKISESLRRRWPIYLWTCPRCVSVWAGIACTAAYFYFPWLNVPLGLSAVYLIKLQIDNSLVKPQPIIPGKQLHLAVDDRGNINLIRTDFNHMDMMSVLTRLSAALRNQSRAS